METPARFSDFKTQTKLNRLISDWLQRYLAGWPRGSTRIKSFYLKTILRQDANFFYKETTTGEVGRMSGDFLIQAAKG
ncbi:unnamed protein product [Rhodiola kirilowii]